MGRSGDGKRHLLLGWPYKPLVLEILGLSRELNFGFTNCCSNEGNMTNIWNEAVNSTKSFAAKFVGSPARFAIRKKRVFCSVNHLEDFLGNTCLLYEFKRSWFVIFDPFGLLLCFKVRCDSPVSGYNRLLRFEDFSDLSWSCHLQE